MSAPDITRCLTAHRQGYVGGNVQQGRPLLEADDNESARARADDFTAAMQDVAGTQGSVDEGFLPDLVPGQRVLSKQVRFGASSQASVLNYPLKAGSMQLGGRRSELRQPASVVFQREFLQIGPAEVPLAQSGSQHQLSVLRVWDQPVSAIEDVEFLEPAMHGADGAARLRRMSRVETRTVAANNCSGAFAEVLDTLGVGDSATYDSDTGTLRSNARLQLTFGNETPGTCPGCDPLLQGRYLGQEDHAIRIMLASDSSYVWAYDNAAPLYRAKLIFDGSGARVEMLTPPKDSSHEPELNRVVEILPWSALLENGQPAAGEGFNPSLSNEKVAARVGAIGSVDAAYMASDQSFHAQFDTATLRALGLADPTSTFTSSAAPDSDVLALQWDDAHPQASELNPGGEPGQTGYVYLRFWQLKRPGEASGIPLNAGLPLGRTGVVPTFSGKGRRGDYWHASLRVADPDQIWPWAIMDSAGLPPAGPVEAIAPIALVRWRSFFGPVHRVISIEDCRPNLPAITNRGCCTHVVEQGANARYSSVQEAIDALPASGGRICIRAGTFDGAFQLAGRENVVIEGCGDRTILTDSNTSSALARITSTETGRIILRKLVLRTSGQIGAELLGRNITLDQLTVEAEPGEEQPVQNAIRALDIQGLTIRDSNFRMGATPSPHAALYLRSAGDLLVEGNQITHEGEGPERAWGGIHLLGNSAGIEIRGNRIVSALGHGVTLGSVAWRATDGTDLGHTGAGFGQVLDDGTALPTGQLGPQLAGDLLYYPEPDLPLTDVLITDNEIEDCSGAGVGALAPEVSHDEIARAAPLCMRRTTFALAGTIAGNRLTGNGAGPGAPALDRARGGIILSEVQQVSITRNHIEGPARSADSGPRTGILAAFGADCWITANRITLQTSDPDPAPGLSAGIVVGLDQSGPALERVVNEAPVRDVRIEDNIVHAGHAPALLAYMGGTCSVCANALETRAETPDVEFPMLTVSVLHPTRVSEAIDLPTDEPNAERWVQPQGSAEFLAGRAQTITASGALLVSDNQISTRSRSTITRQRILPVSIYSLGSVTFTDNQLSAIAPPDQLLAHALVIGATTLVAGNRIAESVESTRTTLMAASPLLTLGVDNHLTHCPVIFGGDNNDADLYFAAADNLTWLRLQEQRCEQLAEDLRPDLAVFLAAFFGDVLRPSINLGRDNDFLSILLRREP